jgi:hypothetical protein
MVGYVKRINDATLRVPIGGVRIGSAKYSRLAQINLQSRIITFSRFAIENVPERGRRYLVIHELSHVKEASHNKRFWQLVAEHEPRYKEIGKELDQAFKENVRSEKRTTRGKNGLIYQTRLFPQSLEEDEWDNFSEPLLRDPAANGTDDDNVLSTNLELDPGLLYPLDSGVSAEYFDCNGSDFSSWESAEGGIIHGGSEELELFGDEHLDHM